MRVHDVHCAICGGPVVKVKISPKPRPADFNAAQRGRKLVIDSNEYGPEMKTYDREIITNAEAEWTAKVLVLGYNPNPKVRVNGAFIASLGTPDVFGEVTVLDGFNFSLSQLGDDPILKDTFQCYRNLGEESDFEPVFPFHVPCYQILWCRLCYLIGGSPDLDEDIIFDVMRTLAGTHMLNIDYGSPNPHLGQAHWNSNRGEEIFAADPMFVKGLRKRIQGMMNAGYFAPSQGAEFDLSGSVRQDPFQRLPFDIFLRIAVQCEDSSSLLNWSKASWFANIAFRNAQNSFWIMAIRIQMGWFMELRPCLRNSELCNGSSMRSIFLWAACCTEPRLGMKGGHFLRIANRRRIWNTSCAELTDKYCRKLLPHVSSTSCESHTLSFRDILLSKDSSSRRYVVTRNKQTRLYSKVQKCFWVDEWEDTYERMQVVEAFFMESNGFLTGIALTTGHDKCRMVGSISESPVRFEVVIPAEDWICGMVVHIPEIKVSRGSVGNIGETSPKGITIICKSGRQLYLGETNRGYPVRVFVARPGYQVVGLEAEMAENKPSATFTRLGLITLRNEDLGNRRIINDHIVKRPHWRIDELMWKDDGSGLFGTPYWNNPSLQILHREEVRPLGEIYSWQADVHQELLPQEALVWAKDVTELRQLKKVSIFTTYSHMEDISGVEVEAYRICGLGVDFLAEHSENRRMVGVEGKPETDDRDAGLATLHGPRTSHRAGAKLGRMVGDGDFRIDLDIDGPGGEIITEIFHGFDQDRPVNCLRFRTNRGREVGCSTDPNGCHSGPFAPEWLSIRAPPNRTIVGIIATFANGHSKSERGEPGVSAKSGTEGPRTYNELTTIAALSIPLGIDEETGESDQGDDGDEEEDE